MINIVDTLLRLIKHENVFDNDIEKNILESIGVFSYPPDRLLFLQVDDEVLSLFSSYGIDFDLLITDEDDDSLSVIIIYYSKNSFFIRYEYLSYEGPNYEEYTVVEKLVGNLLEDILELNIELYTSDAF